MVSSPKEPVVCEECLEAKAAPKPAVLDCSELYKSVAACMADDQRSSVKVCASAEIKLIFELTGDFELGSNAHRLRLVKFQLENHIDYFSFF